MTCLDTDDVDATLMMEEAGLDPEKLISKSKAWGDVLHDVQTALDNYIEERWKRWMVE